MTPDTPGRGATLGGTRSDVVVVGVDGSMASVGALTFALAEAKDRGLAVEVVTAWSWPDPGDLDTDHVFARTARRRAFRAQLAVVARARRLVPEAASVELTAVVAEGDAAEIMVNASVGAHWLVLGAPAGSGSSRRTVRERCSREAGCPVVVVPEAADDVRHDPPATLLQELFELEDVPGGSHVGA